MTRPIGRPTKYTDEMPQRLLDFFSVDLDRDITVQNSTASGKVVEVAVSRPNRLPTVEGFCASIPIAKSTFQDWCKAHDTFRVALGKCKVMQMNHLIQHTLEGSYNAGFAKFLAMNISEYRDKVEIETSSEIRVILPDDRATKL